MTDSHDPYSELAAEEEMRLASISARRGGGFLVDLNHANVFAHHECRSWEDVLGLLRSYSSEVAGTIVATRAYADQLKARFRDADDGE
jgi:hypothetical protein